MTIHDFAKENKTLHLELGMAVSQAKRYEELWMKSMSKFNYLFAQHAIAKDALNNIAERNFIPPSMASDVAVDALYRIGEVEAESK